MEDFVNKFTSFIYFVRLSFGAVDIKVVYYEWQMAVVVSLVGEESRNIVDLDVDEYTHWKLWIEYLAKNKSMQEKCNILDRYGDW